jgi:hypothetical protein
MPQTSTATATAGISRTAAWLAVGLLTVGLSAFTTAQAMERYRAMQSGWSWDLAYYNQWFWVLTHGGDTITVNPVAAYAVEGPWLWKNTYLAPVRLLIAPFYWLWPDPRLLLVVQNVVIWWVVPASYTLVRSETRSDAAALGAAALVPLTPLLWPLVWNDFRELQLALPFVLWAVQGVRGRNVALSALGIGGMLACRQEFAVVTATLGLIPPREEEDVARSYRWANALLVLGLSWLMLGFFVYLKFAVASRAPWNYLEQFTGQKASLGKSLETGWEFLAIGLGVWALCLVLAPRVALVMVPWLWGLASGRWALRYLPSVEWHHVRYAAPMVATGLAAGLVGYGRLARWLLDRTGSIRALGVAWVCAAGGSALLLAAFLPITWNQPHPMDPAEVREVWRWVERVGPDDGVVTAYEVAAPLSSRWRVYGYTLSVNPPPSFPWMRKEFQWVFYRTQDAPQPFEQQGFRAVHRGRFLTIYHRDSEAPP